MQPMRMYDITPFDVLKNIESVMVSLYVYDHLLRDIDLLSNVCFHFLKRTGFSLV